MIATTILQPQAEEVDEPISEFRFAISARSSNPEAGTDDEDNHIILAVPIRVETNFRVTGLSTPPEVSYNISEPLPSRYEFEEDIGEVVIHTYDVRNKGPSAISEAEVYILWPSFNDYGDHLLYLLGFDYDHSLAKCESVKNLNPLSLKVNFKLTVSLGRAVMSSWIAETWGEHDIKDQTYEKLIC